jgi:histidyl-tRNA synthetase
MLAGAIAPEDRPIAVVPMDDAGEALRLTQRLREAGHTVDLGFSGNMKKRLARANKLNARAAIILGAEEWARGAVILRDLDRGAQEEIPLAMLEDRLSAFR